ncbi:hypothetical protein [Vibrio sp. VB16]|uniref:hypothetical protein n=1 Tax=Vibrio sp. VB16 TaxID=2785746 RepID=UPI0018A0F23D|nr:hypothetical protein [Vibrio sp. VB16]UGA53516.1 hypothetical protein IUZ65_009370 [Vibrio sp. VB16]
METASAFKTSNPVIAMKTSVIPTKVGISHHQDSRFHGNDEVFNTNRTALRFHGNDEVFSTNRTALRFHGNDEVFSTNRTALRFHGNDDDDLFSNDWLHRTALIH